MYKNQFLKIVYCFLKGIVIGFNFCLYNTFIYYTIGDIVYMNGFHVKVYKQSS